MNEFKQLQHAPLLDAASLEMLCVVYNGDNANDELKSEWFKVTNPRVVMSFATIDVTTLRLPTDTCLV